jgi:hypothetical protein
MTKGQKQGISVIAAIISGISAISMLPEQAPFNQIGLVLIVVCLICIYMIFAAKEKTEE